MDCEISNQLIWKITGDCNLRCKYCHFFSDPDIDAYPISSDDHIINAVVERITSHLISYNISTYSVNLEGGEPLVIGKKKLLEIIKKLRNIEIKTNAKLKISLTTNATLLDEEWVNLFIEHNINVAVSLDGKNEYNDLRIYATGKSSYENVIKGIDCLRRLGKDFYVLAVANPQSNPKIVLDGIINDTGVRSLDFLIPKYNYDDKESKSIKSIGLFFSELFELWYKNYYKYGIKIRICEDILKLLLGKEPNANTIRGSEYALVLIESNGAIQSAYNLERRISESKNTLNVLQHELIDIKSSPDWLKLNEELITLPMLCNNCEYKNICRGGIPYTRYSKENGYKNPTIYCDDIKKIFSSAWEIVREDLVFK